MRVAFIIASGGNQWLGGTNYFRGLFQALALHDPQSVKPVVIAQPTPQKETSPTFPGVQIIRSHLVRLRSLAYYLRKSVEYASGRDLLLEGLFRRHQISISSHGPALGNHSSIPSLCWIPDFQHLHLPEFFSKEDVCARTRQMMRMGERCTLMLLSSSSARDDIARFMPQILPKVRVLHFAPPITAEPMLPIEQLQSQYGFMGKYIFLPNQYWAHKNHLTVIAALQLLKMQGEKVQLISTGLTEDYRNPNHFTNILRAVEAGGLGDLYKILGVIPYHDMASLMYHSQAVINPSLFEGWSTTVEEAKILEKRLLLSDIPVHREQAQDHALYFSPQSPSSCAQAIKTTWHANPVPVSPNYQQNAQAAAQEFCDNYCAILVEAMKLQQTFGRHS